MGILDAALAEGRRRLQPRAERMSAFERVSWTKAVNDIWLAEQAFEGMARAVETGAASPGVQRGSLAISELAEASLILISKAIGGASYPRSFQCLSAYCCAAFRPIMVVLSCLRNYRRSPYELSPYRCKCEKAQTKYASDASVNPAREIVESNRKRFSPVADSGRPRPASNAVKHSRPPSRGRNGSRLNSAVAMENSAINRTPIRPNNPISPPNKGK